DGDATLLATHFVAEEAAIDDVRRSFDLAAELVVGLRDRGLAQARVGVVGVEVLPFSFGEELRRAFPRLRLQPADDLSAELRRALSEAEVEALRRASSVGARVYDAFTSALEPGATEGDAIAAGLGEAARLPGCTHWTFPA